MFGSHLKAARERARLTQKGAAAAIGLSEDSIYRFERDSTSPSMETLDKMATAYGVLPGDLLPNSGRDGDVRFEPIAAALLGLSDEEIAEEILNLASQARLFRNSVLRRDLSRPTISAPSAFKDSQFVTEETLGYTPSPSEEILGAALLGEGRVRNEGERDVPVGDRPTVRNRAGKRR